jgi:hypothetical protein
VLRVKPPKLEVLKCQRNKASNNHISAKHLVLAHSHMIFPPRKKGPRVEFFSRYHQVVSE